MNESLPEPLPGTEHLCPNPHPDTSFIGCLLVVAVAIIGFVLGVGATLLWGAIS